MNILGERLRKTRESLALKQYQVSELTHINKRTISSYECGASFPSINTLVTFSNLYKVSIDYLVDNSFCDSSLIDRINTLSNEEQLELLEFIEYIKWKRHKNKK